MAFFLSIVPPNLITKPSDKKVIENEQLQFRCTATGNPVPKIRWMKDGRTVGFGEILSLGAQRNQSGEYWCSVDNGLSEAVNASADLDVQCKYDNVVALWSGVATEAIRSNIGKKICPDQEPNP